MSDVIKLADGRYFSFDNPEGHYFRIEPLAHALGMICRFTGHTSRHYSVAQHSLLVSYLVPQQFALQGLMHDAHEALVNDLASPLKRRVPDYKVQEGRVESAMRRAFGLPVVFDESVKVADQMALLLEQKELFIGKPEDPSYWPGWPEGQVAGPFALQVLSSRLSPEAARNWFLRRFNTLWQTRPNEVEGR